MESIKRVYIAHTINTVALSVISIYVPIYLLTLGYPLSQVILFYVNRYIGTYIEITESATVLIDLLPSTNNLSITPCNS